MPGQLLVPERSGATLKSRPWAGRLLGKWARERGIEMQGDVGESWEFSTMPGSESMVDGRPLAEVLGAQLPFLAKLIDTRDPLSIQVHPRGHEPGFEGQGKEEAWVILGAQANSTIWAGICEGVTRGQLAHAMNTANATPSPAHTAALLKLLVAHSVSAGMVFLIPAGTVHAIGGGIFLAEIQQPSDATLRLHDYGSDRDLHASAALRVLDLAAMPQRWPGTHEPRSTASAAGLSIETLAPSPADTASTPASAPGWARLAGESVHLEIGTGPGRYRLSAHDAVLLIPVQGTILAAPVASETSTAAIDGANLAPGELRLWTRANETPGPRDDTTTRVPDLSSAGDALELSLSPDAVLVIGRVLPTA